LNGEGGNNERDADIRIVRSELQFHTEVSPTHVAFLTRVLTLPLPERPVMAVFRYRNISGPHLHKLFSLFSTAVVTLRLCLLISWTFL
jgi:hypothetical protein